MPDSQPTDAETLLPDDPTTEPFWRAALEGRLLLQRCESCAHTQLYPRPICAACGTLEPAWIAGAGLGEVYSVTTVHLQAAPDLEPPYQVALVDLDEGPRVLGVVDGDVRIGQRVRGKFTQRRGLPRLHFDAASSANSNDTTVT